MREYVKRLRDERGLTVIELVASMSLLALFGGLVYGVVLFGLNTYNKVEIENSLRDEADLIMSSIINELYTVAPERISAVRANGLELHASAGGSQADIYFEADEESGKYKLMIDGRELTDLRAEIDAASTLSLTCSSGLGECTSGLISIQLTLYQTYAGNKHQLKLESRFGF